MNHAANLLGVAQLRTGLSLAARKAVSSLSRGTLPAGSKKASLEVAAFLLLTGKSLLFRKLVPIRMNRGFAFNAVPALLDDRFPRLELLDDRRRVAVTIPMAILVPFADG